MMSQHVRVKTSSRTCGEVNLVLSSRNNERIFHEKVQEFFTKTKETGISAERPALNLSKIFIGLVITRMRQQQVFNR